MFFSFAWALLFFALCTKGLADSGTILATSLRRYCHKFRFGSRPIGSESFGLPSQAEGLLQLEAHFHVWVGHSSLPVVDRLFCAVTGRLNDHLLLVATGWRRPGAAVEITFQIELLTDAHQSSQGS